MPRAPSSATARPARRRRSTAHAAARAAPARVRRARTSAAARDRRRPPRQIARAARAGPPRPPGRRPSGPPPARGAASRAGRRSRRRAAAARAPVRHRACAGRGSSTVPPPKVSGGATWRSTNRSPDAGTSGCSSRSCTNPCCPGPSSGESSSSTRAGVSRVPWCTCTRAPRRSGRAPGNTRTAASTKCVATGPPCAARTTSPRRTSSRSTPARFRATRRPAGAAGTRSSCTCTARTRAGLAPGSSLTSWPSSTTPAHNVPVTTVPTPRNVKQRSTCRQTGPSRAGRGARPPATSSSTSRSRSRPVRSLALTGTTGALAYGVGASSARTSVATTVTLRLAGGVDLGERDSAGGNTEHLHHLEVLTRLRHHAVVGRNDEQEEVDAGCAGDHGAHEALVPRHVDDAQLPPGRQRQPRKAQLDGDARGRAPAAGGRC